MQWANANIYFCFFKTKRNKKKRMQQWSIVTLTWVPSKWPMQRKISVGCFNLNQLCQNLGPIFILLPNEQIAFFIIYIFRYTNLSLAICIVGCWPHAYWNSTHNTIPWMWLLISEISDIFGICLGTFKDLSK